MLITCAATIFFIIHLLLLKVVKPQSTKKTEALLLQQHYDYLYYAGEHRTPALNANVVIVELELPHLVLLTIQRDPLQPPLLNLHLIHTLHHLEPI